MSSRLESELAKKLDPGLVKGLVEDFGRMEENARVGNFAQVLVQGGITCEDVLKILANKILGQAISGKGIDVDDTIKKLLQVSKPDLDSEALALLVPSVARAAYSVRSKRKAAHSRGIDPLPIDAFYVQSSVRWLVAELLRVYHESTADQTATIMKELVRTDLPALESFSGEIAIVDDRLECSEAALLILLQLGSRASTKDVRATLKRYYSESTVSRSFSELRDRRLIFEDANKTSHLTGPGYDAVLRISKKPIERHPKDL